MCCWLQPCSRSASRTSPWADRYHEVLAHHLRLDLGFWTFDESLHGFVVDGLMTLFFLLVGMEIKREATSDGPDARYRHGPGRRRTFMTERPQLLKLRRLRS